MKPNNFSNKGPGRPKMNLLPKSVPDVSKTQVPAVCHGHTRPVVDLHYSSVLDESFACRYLNGSSVQIPPYLMFSASKDATAVVRDGSTGDWLGTLKGHKGCIWSCRLSTDGSLGVTGSADFTAKLWDIQKQQLLLTFAHNHIVRAVDISSDSRYIATAGHDKVVRVFDLNSSLDADGAMQPIRELKGSDSEIKAMLFDSERGLLFTGDGNEMRVWDLRVAAQVNSRTFEAPLRCLRYSSSGRFVMTAAGNSVSFWDADTAELYKTLDMHLPVSSVDLHPSESKFVFGNSGDCEVRVARFDNGEVLETYKGHHGPAHVVQYTPDGEKYASGSEDGTVRIWRTELAAPYTEPKKQWVDNAVPYSNGNVSKVAQSRLIIPDIHMAPSASLRPELSLETNFPGGAHYYNSISSPLHVTGQVNGGRFPISQRMPLSVNSLAAGAAFSPLEAHIGNGRLPMINSGLVGGPGFSDQELAPYANSAMMSPFPLANARLSRNFES